ncbi:hypothetical protein BC936DRAFT_149722, partial [Jimgerdemannia flammicorona]
MAAQTRMRWTEAARQVLSITIMSADIPALLELRPITQFEHAPAAFRQPIELTCFSYDANRKLHMNDSELKYYYPPDLRTADLSHGYKDFIQRGQGAEHLDGLLDALTFVRSKAPFPDNDSAKSDFVCTPCSFFQPFRFLSYTHHVFMFCTCCTGDMERNYHKNYVYTIYLERAMGVGRNPLQCSYIEEHDTEYRRQNQYGMTERHQLMTYWGYKFEALSTISRPPSEIASRDDPLLLARRQEVVNTNVQYGTVVKTKLGRNTLILGAEVDCISG